jgi:hypothetical protein
MSPVYTGRIKEGGHAVAVVKKEAMPKANLHDPRDPHPCPPPQQRRVRKLTSDSL